MEHLDQHTLELYVLHSGGLELSSRQIERHLAECPACREIYVEIAEFYDRAGENIARLVETDEPVTEALVRKPHLLRVPDAEPVPRTLTEVRPSVVSLIRYIRRRPLVAGAGVLAAGSALWGLSLLIPSGTPDRNAAYFNLNPGSNRLEIYNSSNTMLWELPVTGIESAVAGEKGDRLPRVVVTDLDGDSQNEVVATLESVGGSTGRNEADLFVYSSDSKLLAHVTGFRSVRFRGEEYSDVHLYGGVVIQDFDHDGVQEIVCRAFSGRSPMGVLRFDMRGKLLGGYWHYGHLPKLLVSQERSGKPEIVLAGSNDAEGGGDFGSAVLVLLDPARITGETEASTTPGFGLPSSRAEIACVRFPNTPLNRRYRSKAGIGDAYVDLSGTSSNIHLWWTALLPAGVLDLEYVLGSDLAVQTIKTSDKTSRLLAALEHKGELSARDIQQFLPSVRSGIEYWDGRSWHREPCRITDGSP